jgi:hypothetical protein
MGRIAEDITGQTFNRLRAIERHSTKPRYWICVCVCGNKKEVFLHNLKQGMVKSCGCLVREHAKENWRKQAIKNRKEFGYANSRKIYSQKKRDAKNRGIDFEITFDDFRTISSKNCFYCNVEPLQSNDFGLQTYGVYKYNGMDRVNPAIGYKLDNIVPCCWNCNKAKSSLSQDEFKSLIRNIYNNWANG